MSWEKDLQRWLEAGVVDNATAERIRQFESAAPKGWPLPAILAVAFGTVMLCGGILLFVAAHWDVLSPGQRFSVVLTMVAAFHVIAALLSNKAPAIAVALHFVGTAALGAGVFLAGQIFNLSEHWPGGLMLWALGAVVAWPILRQWPQALLAAVLIPCWLGGEWQVATENYRGAWHIAAQGFLLLSILYFSVPRKDDNRPLRLGLAWVGCLFFLPFIGDVIFTGNHDSWWWYLRTSSLPSSLAALGWLVAYAPVLAVAAFVRRRNSLPMFLAALWVFVLGVLSRVEKPLDSPGIYVWVVLGACGLCYWGVRDNRKLFINYGTAIFALDLIIFYFSDVFDKLGRSLGLIVMGVIFLGGGWLLNRLRGDLIEHAATVGGRS